MVERIYKRKWLLGYDFANIFGRVKATMKGKGDNLITKVFNVEKKLVWFDALVLILIVLYVIAVWWPVRLLPYHWNTAILVVNAARDLISRNYSPLTLSGFGTSQPPLFQLIISGLWKWFGDSRVVTHASVIPSMVVVMQGTYVLGKTLVNRMSGLIALVLVGFSPLFVSSMGIIDIHVIATSFMVLASVLWVYDKRWWALGILAIGVLVKVEVGLLILTLWLWDGEKTDRNEMKKLLAPVAVMLGWFVYHNAVAGWWTTLDFSKIISTIGVRGLLIYGWEVVQISLIWHMKWLLSGMGIVALGVLWLQNKTSVLSENSIRGLAAGIGAYLILWTVVGRVEEVNTMMIFPFWVILCLKIVSKTIETFKIKESEWYMLSVGFVLVLVWLSQWRPVLTLKDKMEFVPQADLSYQDVITVGREMASFLELVYPNTKIYGGFPETYQLTQPYQGYVTKPLNISLCKDFDPESQEPSIVVIHPYHSSQIACQGIRKMYSLKPLQRFEQNGQWIELFEYNKQLAVDRPNQEN